MNKKISENLVNAIKNTLPEKTNVAMYLMDLLSLGKEAVYRRLRGTVSFDLEEAALISMSLNISLDQIVGMESRDRAIFNLNLIRKSDLLDDYCRFIESYTYAVRQLKPCPYSKRYSACNIVPFSFYTEYDLIAKFFWYKWLYQMEGFENMIPFSEFLLPPKVPQIHKQFIEESRFIDTSSFVLARNMFTSLAKDIAFFSRLNLLSKDDVEDIKFELVALLSRLESIAASGVWNEGKNLSFYLSNIDFESSYTFLECDEFELSILRVFSFGTIQSFKGQVCNVHREWFDSLQRSSTLISRSGDLHRAEYFNEQRELVKDILGVS